MFNYSIALAFAALAAHSATADEGMWLFNQPPLEKLQAEYGFSPTSDWLQHIQRSSIRFNSGGSGSFVSPSGLILTNHHVGREHVFSLSTAERNLTENGFYAATNEEELRVPGLELNVLMEIKDVTERVKAAVTPGMSPEAANAARRAIMAEIESESLEASGMRSDVVTLHRGGLYHLYRYKRYTDVRLVMAPEDPIGYFGGDPDNFDYPRWSLDFTFFRAWEDGQPAVVKDYLRWSDVPTKEGDLVFVSGHPGSTQRQQTYDQIKRDRDLTIPQYLRANYRLETALGVFSEISPEHERMAKETLFFVKNSRKANNGAMDGLLGTQVLAQKLAAEIALREELRSHPEFRDAVSAFDDVVNALHEITKVRPILVNLEWSPANWSSLTRFARTLLRAADERTKPSGERLREFRQSNLPSIENELVAEVPIYAELETILIENYLVDMANDLGSEHPLVKLALAGQTPSERARKLVKGTKLADATARKALWRGGKEAVDASTDPLIEFARALDPAAREARKVSEAQSEMIEQALGKIARARFALYGTSVYPDATFTLRISIGTVGGVSRGSKQMPWRTTYSSMLEVANSQKRYELPELWNRRADKLDPNVGVCFLSDNDSVGGNSGSPVVDR